MWWVLSECRHLRAAATRRRHFMSAARMLAFLHAALHFFLAGLGLGAAFLGAGLGFGTIARAALAESTWLAPPPLVP